MAAALVRGAAAQPRKTDSSPGAAVGEGSSKWDEVDCVILGKGLKGGRASKKDLSQCVV